MASHFYQSAQAPDPATFQPLYPAQYYVDNAHSATAQPSFAPLGSPLPPAYGPDLNPPFNHVEYAQHSHPQYPPFPEQPSYGYPLASLALDNDVYHNNPVYASDPVYSQNPPPDPYYQPLAIPLHSPVPLSGASPPFLAPSQPPSFSPPTAFHAHHSWSAPSSSSAPAPAEFQDLMQHYANIPREMFPTPSELLSNSAETTPQPPPRLPLPPARSLKSVKEETTKRNETLRQARLRFMAESIGFPPTDPDGMSCHDKKRCYLECLEEYVVYLRDQATLAGLQPIELERVSTYRGLNSRSIRTMIVHMEDKVRDMHQNTLKEEAAFLGLRDQVLTLEAAGRAHELQRRPV